MKRKREEYRARRPTTDVIAISLAGYIIKIWQPLRKKR
jgi:hypothetical protein